MPICIFPALAIEAKSTARKGETLEFHPGLFTIVQYALASRARCLSDLTTKGKLC